jgi:hypothetical protein
MKPVGAPLCFPDISISLHRLRGSVSVDDVRRRSRSKNGCVSTFLKAVSVTLPFALAAVNYEPDATTFVRSGHGYFQTAVDDHKVNN